MGSLTRGRGERLKRLIEFLEHSWEKDWTSPTVRDVADHMGWSSTGTAYNFLRDAARDGFIETKRVSVRRVLYRPARDVRLRLWS